MKVTINNQEFYMDGYLKENMDRAKSVIQDDWDMIFAVDGYEGSGKSFFAATVAYYCDPTLCIDRITFSPNEFRKAISTAKQYEAVIYDEGYSGLSSRASMSMINRMLVNMLTTIRQKNLFVFIVMPSFFDMDKYPALWRSRGLFHIYTDNFKRGFFAFYNIDKKKDLYILGKKFYEYNKVKPNFIGRFTNFFPLDLKEYKAKKYGSTVKHQQEEEEKAKLIELDNALFEKVMKMGDSVPHKIKMQILDMPSSTYFRKISQYKEIENQ